MTDTVVAFVYGCAVGAFGALVAEYVATRNWTLKLHKRTPQVGERWSIEKRATDPWGISKTTVAEILSVQDGWVKYRFYWAALPHAQPSPWTVTVGDFVSVYSPPKA